jgi:hypothetical protein
LIWLRNPSGRFGKEKNLLAFLRIETRYAIPAPSKTLMTFEKHYWKTPDDGS